LVLEVPYRHTTVKTPYCKAMSEQMRMDAMPIFACFILALDLLQFGSSGYAIKDILDLPCGDMPITIARE
jgi:hypothetical protein